jgi:hypothetical protein
LAPKANFHPIWGAAAPAIGLFRTILIAAGIGAIAGATVMSSLVERSSEEPHVAASDHGFRIDRRRQAMPGVASSTHTTKSQLNGTVQAPNRDIAPETSVETPKDNSRGEEFEKQATSTQSDADGLPCNVSVCEQHYQSFRSSDCTYQPYAGPRRYCRR